MDILERIWEFLGLFFGGLLRGFERGVTGLFGSSNARYIRKLQPVTEEIGLLESKYAEMSDDELAAQTDKFRERLAQGETLEDIMVEAFAVCREAGKRYLKMRHYDVQLVGGIVLHRGAIAEMVTGEGKTLVATLPAYLNALEGKGVHVVTVNDYLARRDMEWMAPLYMGLGLTVGAIQSDMPVLERQRAYACDITYGTNNEFGFDYLRDNMRQAARGDNDFPKQSQQSQGRLHYAIVDEVDNILIDEARTPLIISGPAHENVKKYAEADAIAKQLVKNEHFEVKEKEHTAHMTDEGIRHAEKLAKVESFYTAGNMDWPHLIDNSLKAHHLYKRDVNYVVEDGKVVIIDEFTGRKMEGRQWSDGLHQVVEAKERVKIKEETQTLATVTLQNFFKLYDKLGGMTGTAMTEASEFWKIYELDVVAIPTNRPMKRLEHPDVIYRTEREKYVAVAEEIESLIKWDRILADGEEIVGQIVKESDDSLDFLPDNSRKTQTYPLSEIEVLQRRGRPILVGTVSIEKSERISDLLSKRGVKHDVLNAKHHKREAEIVAQAGRRGGVTIATNMAGRGTDIVLGGNPETMAWARLQNTYASRLDVPPEEWRSLVDGISAAEKMPENGETVKSIGGLHVIGTERHESRRIDLQLRGRCGRQGDPGSSRFFLSLEDDLMRIFAGEWVRGILDRLGMQEGEAIESRLVTRRIEAAQKKVEERNFEIRKNLLEYDEVMDEQRKRLYSYRQQILDGAECKQLILEMIRGQIEHYVQDFLNPQYGIESFAKWATNQLHVSSEFEARQFRGLDFQSAEDYAHDEARRSAEGDIFEKIEETLPEGEDEDDQTDWNWEALAKFANLRWGANYRDQNLKKIGRDHIAEELIKKAHAAIDKVDLSEAAPLLKEDYGLKSTVAWARQKFDITLELEEIQGKDAAAICEMVYERAANAYAARESEYPVMAGLYRFTTQGGGGQPRLDREQLIAWAQERFHVDLNADEFKNKQRGEIREALVAHSAAYQKSGVAVLSAVKEKAHSLVEKAAPGQTVREATGGNGAIETVADWLNKTLNCKIEPSELESLDADALETELSKLVEDRFRPEMRRMERAMLLHLVDMAWKDHLLGMDHLRSYISLVGYAQLDAKVEFKREGMRLFEEMWQSIGERVSDLIFRMEQLDENFVSSTWVETSAKHDQARPQTESMREQNEAIDNSQDPDKKIDPIRNRGQHVRRNDPCPCGSGKKFKNCCLRKN